MLHGKDLAVLTGGTLLVGEELPPSVDPRSPLQGNCRIRLRTGFKEFKEVQPLWRMDATGRQPLLLPPFLS